MAFLRNAKRLGEGGRLSFRLAELWAMVIVTCLTIGCSCDSSNDGPSITITDPLDDRELIFLEDDADPDLPGFQYTVQGTSTGLDIERAIELLIDDESFDVPMFSSPDDDGVIEFEQVTLPPGSHTLGAKSRTGSVYSDPVHYILYNLAIFNPEDGMTIRRSQDENSEESGIQQTVVVNAYGFSEEQDVSLIVIDEQGNRNTLTQTLEAVEDGDDGARQAVFEEVSLPSGRVSLRAEAEISSEVTVQSSEHTVTVTSCPKIEFISPRPPSSQQLKLDANDDTITDDGPCGEEFGIDVMISVQAENNSQVTLSVNPGNNLSSQTYKRSLQSSVAVFEQVVLDSSNAAPNAITVQLETAGGSSCSEKYPVDIVVDCSDVQNCDDDDPCGDHGSCSETKGVITCSCDTGYAGDTCNQCAAGFHDEASDGELDCALDVECRSTTCSGRGTCDDTGGVVTCSDCETGYTGDYCSDCDAGYHPEGANCTIDQSCAADGSSCNYRGTCSEVDGTISCSDCDEGFVGDYCDECDPDIGDGVDDPCGEHGECSHVGRPAFCICGPGYTGADCTECAPGFHLDVPSGDCIFDTQCLPTSCNRHGECDDSTTPVECSNCDEGFVGDFCDECDPDIGDGVDDPCGERGHCDDSSGVAVCDCDVGYKGDPCEECQEGFQDNDGDTVCQPSCEALGGESYCNDQGTCSDESGTAVCTCSNGYTGVTCSVCPSDLICEGICCGAEDRCYDGACCTPLSCDELDPFVECGETGVDDLCGDTVHCGYCGGLPNTCGTLLPNQCICDDNYGMLEGGHECVYACDGYLQSQGCCGGDTGDTLFFCNSNGFMTWLECPDGCGWSDSRSLFDCGGVPGDGPGGEPMECPANIQTMDVSNCVDDDYEDPDPSGDDPANARMVADGDEITATKCGEDEDFYGINLQNMETLTVTAYYNYATMPYFGLILYYDSWDGTGRYVVSYSFKTSSPVTFQWQLNTAETYGDYRADHYYADQNIQTGTYYIQVSASADAFSDYVIRFTVE